MPVGSSKTNSTRSQLLPKKNLVVQSLQMEIGSLLEQATLRLSAFDQLAPFIYLNALAINGFCDKQYFIQLQARIKRLEIPLPCDKIILWLVHGAAMDIREVCLYSHWVRMVVGHLHPL